MNTEHPAMFQHGDLVFAKVKGYPFWPARIDCVRLEKCRKKKQKNNPDDATSYWPIFFYGTHETLWINESDLRPFEENRSSLGNASNKKKFKEAMIEAFTNPCKQFQFQDNDHDKIERWLSGIDGDEAETTWVAIEKEEILKEKLKAEAEKEKNEKEESSEENLDIISREFEKSLIKIKDIEVNDSVGGMYDVPCYGQVIEKTEKSIKVQFYTRKKTTPSDYIIKKKDTDTITETRQGYLFYHLKQTNVEYLKMGKLELMRLSADWSHDQIDKEWNKWNSFTLKLQGIEIPEKIEDETENDNSNKRRRRSRRPEANPSNTAPPSTPPKVPKLAPDDDEEEAVEATDEAVSDVKTET